MANSQWPQGQQKNLQTGQFRTIRRVAAKISASIPPPKLYKWMYENDKGGGYSVMSPTIASEIETFQHGTTNFMVVNNGIGHKYSIILNGDKVRPEGTQTNMHTGSTRNIKRVAGNPSRAWEIL